MKKNLFRIIGIYIFVGILVTFLWYWTNRNTYCSPLAFCKSYPKTLTGILSEIFLPVGGGWPIILLWPFFAVMILLAIISGKPL
jgi:hypothetical protein